MKVYPLSYSIPEELFLNNYKKKIYDIAPLIPGKLETYIYDTEESYYNMYKSSKFGITHKKYGWDCLRHYEILASRCVPIFKDLSNCPSWTMFNFPKEQIIKLNNKNLSDITDQDISDLMDYCKKNLTCIQSAKRVISLISPDHDSPRVLFISGTIGYRNVNYTRELLAIGLRRYLRTNFIDYPKINVLYKGCTNKHKYIGKGFTYSERLDDIDIDRNDISNRILNNEFDFIFYGKVGKKRGEIDPVEDLPFWKDVVSHYNKSQIIFIYGGDLSRNIEEDKCINYHKQYGICFVREGY